MIYIHIPYCKQKCSYCNFHFSTSIHSKDDFLLALHKEIDLREKELESKRLKTLYFGGGTPSLLSVDEIKRILEKIQKYFDLDSNIEITLEANPDDLTAKYVKELSTSGINRLSVGVQSFFDEDLKLMNRAHNASEADSAIKRAQDIGLENISIDLIYGSPTSNLEMWKENLNKTIVLQVPHVSSYALTVEPKTALNQWIKSGKISSPNESHQNEEFYWMVDFLKNQGFEHYEISNFAKPGFHSKHNAAYWKYQPYLGLGPSAHSYDGRNTRSWNVSNNIHYIRDLNQEKLPKEEETLSDYDRYNEALMIGLRTSWGLSLNWMKSNFSDKFMEHLEQSIQPKMDQGILEIENGYLKIPEKHWFMADGIASDLFLLE
ncbi:radical SAM family heme chaperone HemW [Amniculibacterium sp. G2-70]|uniref:radical SAM family heme chaperone HemW n=1 Tax=Amniculibacterium sp. G2-70 TaxID=2767188 RepID=UPI001653F65B|nr:radical SAM family heme chaperone HemW [Amniculibacterium sp. G2-70]